MASLTDSFFTIKAAAELCNLSPSVLRVWEFRYGWPSPQRRPNGYRAFNRAQLEDLKRVANLIRNGMSIGSIIVDGFPRWPSQLTEATKRFPTLAIAKGLACPTSGTARKQQVLSAIERGLGMEALAAAQAACIDLRPRDEAIAVVLPLAIALAELQRDGRKLAGEAELRPWLEQRANQLAARLGRPGQVRVEGGEDGLLRAAAACALVVANRSGAWRADDAQGSRVSWFGDDGAVAVAALLDQPQQHAA